MNLDCCPAVSVLFAIPLEKERLQCRSSAGYMRSCRAMAIPLWARRDGQGENGQMLSSMCGFGSQRSSVCNIM